MTVWLRCRRCADSHGFHPAAAERLVYALTELADDVPLRDAVLEGFTVAEVCLRDVEELARTRDPLSAWVRNRTRDRQDDAERARRTA